MMRHLVPLAFTVAVLGVALTLILVVTTRPWASANESYDTHLNFKAGVPDDYARTDPTYIGTEEISLNWKGADRGLAEDAVKAAFVNAGCASCHGLDGTGGAVGPNILPIDEEKVVENVRFGPSGMPASYAVDLSDEHLAVINEYLRVLKAANPEASQPPPTPTPVPTRVPTPTPIVDAVATPTTVLTGPDSELLELGKLLYDVTAGVNGTGCAYCHGPDGKGGGEAGNTAPDIRGAGRIPIREALRGANDMTDITLSNEELKAVIEYLKFLNQE